MRSFPIVLLVASMFLGGCQNPGVVQVSPNTYMLSREDHAGVFGSMSKLKARVIEDVNAFAAQQGKAAIPISAKEHPVGILGDWATFEVTFRLADKNDPAANDPSIWTNPSLLGGQGWRNLGGKATVYQAPATGAPTENRGGQNPTIGQQLIDLQKAKDAGVITEVEYQAQKAKLLGTK